MRGRTTPARVVLVSPDACGRGDLMHAPVQSEAGTWLSCKTTLHTNARPTLCECGEVLYKVDETMDDPRWDDEETGG